MPVNLTLDVSHVVQETTCGGDDDRVESRISCGGISSPGGSNMWTNKWQDWFFRRENVMNFCPGSLSGE
jgi:hypothetical protein